MHVQLVQYTYDGDIDAFKQGAEALAPAIATLDGLHAKLWLQTDGRRCGGVYLWRDRHAADAYEHGDLFTTAISTNPDVRDLTIARYDLWTAPTAVTNGIPTSATTGQ